MSKKPRLNKDGTPDKRYKANQKMQDTPKQEEKQTTMEVASSSDDVSFPEFENVTHKYGGIIEKPTPLKGMSFEYETVSYQELPDKVINMGDYLLIIPPTMPPLVKIKVSKDKEKGNNS